MKCPYMDVVPSVVPPWQMKRSCSKVENLVAMSLLAACLFPCTLNSLMMELKDSHLYVYIIQNIIYHVSYSIILFYLSVLKADVGPNSSIDSARCRRMWNLGFFIKSAFQA